MHGNRIKHVLDHTVITQQNSKKAIHSLFNVPRKEVLPLIDDAWKKRGNPISQGNKDVFHIDMGRTIGQNGERHIKIVV